MSYRSRHNFYSKMRKPIVFNPHTGPICIPSSHFIPGSHFIQSAFIDPGTKSCAIRIVRFHYLLNQIEVIWFGVLSFGKTIDEILSGVERELIPIINLFQFSHYIVIESQPMIRGDVYRTFQHLISFLTLHIKDVGVRGVVVEVDSKLKTVWIGGPATSIQNGGVSIKEWAKHKSAEILSLRQDVLSQSILSSSKAKAKEDLNDTVCYEYAWWSYFKTRQEIPK